MEKSCPTLAEFQQMAKPEQLGLLVHDGVMLSVNDPEEMIYYKMGDFFVCVTTTPVPFSVKQVEAFAELPILH